MHPQRPPRKEVKKETTGLLVSVVRTLTTSATTEQREREKERLEEGYLETQKTIDALISANQHDLTSCLQSFCKISDRIVRARERVQNIKTNLSSCKTLLQCKRDELQNLWKEGAEQKYILGLLEKIEDVKSVPYKIRESVSKRHFLEATDILVRASAILDSELQPVDGLSMLRNEITRKKDDVFNLILDELNKQLYLRPSEEVLCELRRGGSKRLRGAGEKREEQLSLDHESGLASSGLSIAASEKSNSWGSGLLKISVDDSPVLQDNGCAREDITDSNPETKPVQYIAVLVESLAMLCRVPAAVENIQHKIAKGLVKLIQHTTTFLHDHAVINEDHNPFMSGDNRYLLELLQLLFRQFKFVATLHHLLREQFQRVIDDHQIMGVTLYSNEHVWKNIQSALQNLLQEYLDVKNSHVAVQPFFDSGNNLSAYFVKKKPPKARRPNFFRFDATAHAQNVSAYTKEKKMNAPMSLASPLEATETVLICMPSPLNIIIIYKSLMKFVAEVEAKLGLNPGASVDAEEKCLLRVFIEQYLFDTFLPRLKQDISQKLSTSLKHSDSFTCIIDAEEMKRLDTSVPILVSTVKAVEVLNYLASLMNSMNNCVERIIDLFIFTLQDYNEFATNAYDSLTKSIKLQSTTAIATPGRAEQLECRKISATWAVDEDISRLLKSLPNWLILVQETYALSSAGTPGGKSSNWTPFSPPVLQSPLVESADDIRNRNRRESEILIGNLGMQKKIEESEIIQDLGHLKSMANLHESIEWFCICARRCLQNLPPSVLKRFQQTLPPQPQIASSAPSIVPSDSYAKCLEQKLLSLENISAVWLLMLHLEVRMHCFYFLLPVARQASHLLGTFHSQEVSPSVLSLNRNLVALDELLKLNLQPRKVRYIFEGVGNVVAAIFVNSSQHIMKINDNGKKRMCRNIFSIQQCLSNITMTRETDLDRARKYYELLYNGPDDILNGIMEKGPEFSELEYHYLLALAIRSHQVFGTEQGSLELRLNRLREIMQSRNAVKVA